MIKYCKTGEYPKLPVIKAKDFDRKNTTTPIKIRDNLKVEVVN